MSNFNVSHIMEIVESGLPLPAVNQCPLNPHLAQPQGELIALCRKHNILFNAYSPLGAPDYHSYPGAIGTASLLNDSVVLAIAKAHNRTPAQVLINYLWSHGIVTNPRTMNPAHMRENLASYEFALSQGEVHQLDQFKADACTDDSWYECCGSQTVQPSIPACGPN